jgi:hypothetical protein
MERKQRRTKCMEDRLRLGQFVTERRGVHFEEVWHDGYAFVEINKKLTAINAERDEIARASQLLRKKKPTTTSSGGSSSVTSGGSTVATTVGSSKKQTAVSSSVNPPSKVAATTVVAASTGADEFVKPEPPKE